MKVIRKSLRYVLAFVLLFSLCMTVTAADSLLDWTRDGSITITLLDSDDRTAVPDAEFGIYLLAAASEKGYQLVFELEEPYAKAGLTYEDLLDSSKVSSFDDLKPETPDATAKTDKNGVAKFEDLKFGIYLIVQLSVQDHTASTPFIVAVPTSSESEWVYDIQAEPKTGILRTTELTARKVWENDEENNRPKNVTVQLLRNEEVSDEVVLSAENDWTYTWTDLLAADTWTVVEKNVPENYKATYTQKGTTITITNAQKLIQTGQTNWPIPVLAGAGLALFVVGWILVFLKKKKKYE